MKAYHYDGGIDEDTKEIPIPDHLVDKAEEKRIELLEAIADFNEELMIMYLEGEEIPIEMIKETIRKATLDVKFFPVFCGTAFKNRGVKKVLDGVIDYLPAPMYRWRYCWS